jgi:hypothetical protein
MASQNEMPRIERPMRPQLSATDYRVGTAISFMAWGAILLIFFYSRLFEAWFKRDDLIGLAQTVAGLAAVALAIITIVQETGSRDRFLKLLLAAITLLLLLATLLGWLAVFTIEPVEKNGGTKLLLRVVMVAGVYLALGASGIGVAITGRRKSAKIHAVYDYSPFVAPFVAFAIWSPQGSLTGIAIALSVGGMAYLVVSTIVLLLSLWGARTHQEDLESQVIGILEGARVKPKSGGSRQPVALDYLRNKLTSNDETLLELLNRLCREDRIFRVDDQAYFILRAWDWSQCKGFLLEFDVIVLPERAADSLWDDIAREIGEQLYLPDSVVKTYFAERIREFVEKEFKLIALTDLPQGKLYFKEHTKPWPDLTLWKEDREGAGRVILNCYKCLPSSGASSTSTLGQIIGWAAIRDLK